jgi:RNA polymerase sigma factor (sigma-70 family)
MVRAVRPATVDLVNDWLLGDDSLGNEVIHRVFESIQGQARNALRRRARGFQISALTLTQESLVKLLARRQSKTATTLRFPNREALYAYLARVINHTLLTLITRRKNSDGADVALEEVGPNEIEDRAALGELEGSLAVRRLVDKLRRIDARAALVFDLHHELGIPIAEIGASLELGRTQVYEKLSFARKWLALHLQQELPKLGKKGS